MDISYLHLDNQFLNDDPRNDSRCVIIIVTVSPHYHVQLVTSSLEATSRYLRLEKNQQAAA